MAEEGRRGEEEQRRKDAEERAKKGFAEGTTSEKVDRVRKTGVADPDLSEALNQFAIAEFSRERTESAEDRAQKKRLTDAQIRNLDEPNRVLRSQGLTPAQLLAMRKEYSDELGDLELYEATPPETLAALRSLIAQIDSQLAAKVGAGGGAGSGIAIPGLPSGIQSGLSYTPPRDTTQVIGQGGLAGTGAAQKPFNEKAVRGQIAQKPTWSPERVDEAVAYLMRVTGMSREDAVKWLADDNGILY